MVISLRKCKAGYLNYFRVLAPYDTYGSTAVVAPVLHLRNYRVAGRDSCVALPVAWLVWAPAALHGACCTRSKCEFVEFRGVAVPPAEPRTTMETPHIKCSALPVLCHVCTYQIVPQALDSFTL